ncbi:hypothetical protein [Sporomusa malonica]|uniref:hypothetical protein n=1 Tax=Sporomusa malonica TaxID=112901 RepID=UPI0015949508|nr:hypothetical protein [Sporomusa malonica]
MSVLLVNYGVMSVPKRVSSKISSYIKPSQSKFQNQEREQVDDENLIADMARSFMQAQTKLSNASQQTNSQEVVDLLSKINSQLENLQTSLTSSSQLVGQSQQIGQQPAQQPQQSLAQQPQQVQQQPASPQAEAGVSQELRNLFSLLLQNDSQQANPQGNSQDQNPSLQQKQSQRQDQGQGSETVNTPNRNSSIAVQTAAQVLAQAQYELSNELETSLKKLKQVISESEKIANKISNLLGEENSQK